MGKWCSHCKHIAEVHYSTTESHACLTCDEVAEVCAEERRRIVAWLCHYADEAERIPGPPQYEDALRNAAEAIERGDDKE